MTTSLKSKIISFFTKHKKILTLCLFLFLLLSFFFLPFIIPSDPSNPNNPNPQPPNNPDNPEGDNPNNPNPHPPNNPDNPEGDNPNNPNPQDPNNPDNPSYPSPPELPNIPPDGNQPIEDPHIYQSLQKIISQFKKLSKNPSSLKFVYSSYPQEEFSFIQFNTLNQAFRFKWKQPSRPTLLNFSLFSFSSFPQLESLSLFLIYYPSSFLNFKDIRFLSHLNLAFLSLPFFTHLPDFSSLQYLKTLSLFSSSFTFDVFLLSKPLPPNLQHFFLFNSRGLHLSDPSYLLPPSLKTLKFKVSMVNLFFLPHLDNLQDLYLSGNTLVLNNKYRPPQGDNHQPINLKFEGHFQHILYLPADAPSPYNPKQPISFPPIIDNPTQPQDPRLPYIPELPNIPPTFTLPPHLEPKLPKKELKLPK